MPKLKEISEKEIQQAEKYALLNAKDFTIESKIGWNRGFISKRKDISERLRKKRQEYTLELLEAQKEKAVKSKDTAMLCFLGKNYLGQSDRQDHSLNVKFEPININIKGKSK